MRTLLESFISTPKKVSLTFYNLLITFPNQHRQEESMKGNRCLTAEQIQELKKILEQKRQEVLEDIKRGLEETAQSEREVGDLVDMSTDEILRTFEMRIRDREAKYLKKIEKALRKIEEGTYGICEKCGSCISYERLKLRPVAELCIKCKLEQEKFERKFGEE